MIRLTTFDGKRVAIVGLARSGIAAARALAAGGADIACWDDGKHGREAAREAGLPLVELAAADWSTFAALVLAPGIPLTHPEPHWSVQRARAAGVDVIGDVELFFRERAVQWPKSPVVAVTGTNGKSTTTALIAHLLRFAGTDVEMGGNIGTSILSLQPPAPGRIHVVEMSSFQIDLAPSLAPTVGVLLNVSADHLDRHGTLEDYAAIKERLIARAQTACIGLDDEHCRRIAQNRARSHLPARVFSTGLPPDEGYGLFGDEIGLCTSKERACVPVARLTGMATLRGLHNAQNALAAVAAVQALGIADVDFQSALATFPGLPHRLEDVGRIGRTLFINDSKATNADSTAKALASFERGIFWIVGGRPKEGGITALAGYFPRIAKAYLIGESSEQFAATLQGHVGFELCSSLDRAVAAAAAGAHAASEAVVLLSPACASYDQFTSFEHRGDAFRRLVSALPGIDMKAVERI